MTHPITGCLAAALTPLRDGGDWLDEAAFQPLTDFMAGAALDGLLAMGTTGEGILLTVAERRRVTELFVEAAGGRLKVVAHCGAQTTRDTAVLAEHAARAGADGVAVIGPPYFALDDAAILEHFTAAGRACAPLPFYVYEFAARSGYAVPVHVIEQLRVRLPNMAGLKVSDAPWERFAPYLIEGLSVFVGPETLIQRGMERGAVGAVSALAAALPELVLDAVRDARPDASERCRAARDAIQRFPLHAALKRLLVRRGVAMTGDVRGPLRQLTAEEEPAFEAVAAEQLGALGPGLADLPSRPDPAAAG
jgi:dihydrodipicolinate synthase/N-acetylneuraminate lyase